jgi:hypothetical protein
LDENTDGIVAYTPGRGSDAPLKTMAAHACSASDRTLLDRSTTSAIKRREGVLGRNMEAIDIIQAPIVRLSHDRKRPEKRGVTIPLPSDHRITHHTYAMRIGNQNRTLKQPRMLNPSRTGHFTVSIQAEPCGES